MGKDVIIALDFDSREKTLAFLDRFTEEKPFVKVGMELFYAEGPAIVREIRRRGHRIFLDLKLHDIPNTVRKAMAALSALDVDIINLHAAGTAAMMTAALEGLTRPDGTRPLLIAVTQLTSTDRGAHGAGAADRRPAGGGGAQLRRQRRCGGAGRRGLLPAGGRSHPPALRGRLPDGDPRRPASPEGMPGIRSGSPPPPRPVSWALITSWWAAPSRRPRTLWRPIAAV